MATAVQIEHGVTFANGKLDDLYTDVRVTADVHNDGEVIITNIEMTGVVARVRSPHHPDSFKRDEVTEPMTDSSNPHIVRLANWAAEILLADDDFIEKAHAAAGLVYVGLGGNDPDGHFRRVA